MEVRTKTKLFKAFKAIDIAGLVELLRASYPLRRMAIFLDNASIHRANIVREACEKYHVTLLFNIPYCPHLNGIE